MKRRAGIRRQPPATSRSVIVPLTALALGWALVVVAFPRLVSALYAVPANTTIAKLEKNDPGLTPGELLAARQALQYSLAWEMDGGTAIKLARVTLSLAARQFRAGGNPALLIDETIEAARTGLRLAPAQARGWLLLAEATLAKTSDPGSITPFLIESVRASPHDIWLAPNRAELGLRSWAWLEPQAREVISDQIRLTAWRWPDRTVAIARRAGDPGPVREALAGDVEKLRRFDALYLQAP